MSVSKKSKILSLPLKEYGLPIYPSELELGEASTTEITVQQDAQGFQESKEAAQAGGKIAGNARKELEAKSGRRVVSPSNFLSHQQDLKGLLPKAFIGEEKSK